MKRKAVLLAAGLLFLGGIQAWAAVETAPMPQGGPAATAPVVSVGVPAVVTEGAPCQVCECVPCCKKHGLHLDGAHMDQAKECVGRIWDWLTYRPHWCNSPSCCCKHCACCCPPVYNWFYCKCVPHEHIGFDGFIGQGMPPAPHCGCCPSGGCADCGCH